MFFKEKRKNKTIFRYFLVPMLLMVLLELVLWKGSFAISGMFDSLDQNSRALLDQRVLNRATYLERDMLYSWSDLEGLAEKINEKALKLQKKGTINFETLDEASENAMPLLSEILDPMIRTMRTSRVTGIYVIFNDEDLDQGWEDKSGVYIRDADPLSKPSSNNGDLLFERAPIEIVENSKIATSSTWRPRFEFKKRQKEYYDFFYTPFQTALHSGEKYSVSELGYWGKIETLDGNDTSAMTYSIPLVNQEGKVYGILGIDITLNYLNKLLPAEELCENDTPSSYILAVMNEKKLTLEPVFCRGNAYNPEKNKTQLVEDEEGYHILDNENKYYTAVTSLDLYVSNTPYSQQKWILTGVVEEGKLYSFRLKLQNIMRMSMILLCFLGVCISLCATYLIAKPIHTLSDQVETAVPGQELRLKRTRIMEIDMLEQKIEALDRNIRNTALKFTNILKMSSIEMAGYEYNEETRELFVSDNFFEIFREYDVNTQNMSLETFLEKKKGHDKYLISHGEKSGELLYEIPNGKEKVYVRVRFVIKGANHTGVAENVTKAMMDRKRIEYERDHDALTGLLNRRAFLRSAKSILKRNHQDDQIASLLMLDLDNLKYVNDTYGHDVGDRYIQKAAEILNELDQEHVLISRISGDEFNILFFGYEEKEEVRSEVKKLEAAIKQARIILPDGESYPFSASGGFSWFSKESNTVKYMQKHADYAMYQIKKSQKGNIKEYESYEQLCEETIREDETK